MNLPTFVLVARNAPVSNSQFSQGTVDKVVVVIKDKEEVALERFIFSVENMVEVESFNKNVR